MEAIVDKALEQMIQAVKEASPALWAAAQHKVQADISVAQSMLWVSVMVVVVGFGLILASILFGGGWEDWPIFAGIFGVIGTIAGAGVFINYYMYLKAVALAPDWYAIKALASLSPLG